jgi:hypothetical protein
MQKIMAHPTTIDWRGPLLMLTCFVGAVILATGHHIFNSHLDGVPVAQFALDQQWVSRAENATAYVVKLLLLLATSTAYFQSVWHHARCRPTKISQFDTMFGALDNIFELRHFGFWLRRPVLVASVMIVWYVPPQAQGFAVFGRQAGGNSAVWTSFMLTDRP